MNHIQFENLSEQVKNLIDEWQKRIIDKEYSLSKPNTTELKKSKAKLAILERYHCATTRIAEILNNDIVKAFKLEIADKLYEQGTSEEVIKEAIKEHVLWSPQKKMEETINAGKIIFDLIEEKIKQNEHIVFLENLLWANHLCKFTSITIEGYLRNPKLFNSDFEIIKQVNK